MSKKTKNNEDMIGFKDFLDGENNKKPTRNKRIDNDNYELISFLEKDAKRLSNQIDLYEEKSYLIKSFPQDTRIIIRLESELYDRKLELIEKFKEPNSALRQNISDILSAHFSS